MPHVAKIKRLTASGAIKASKGLVYGVTLAAGSDAATVTLENSTDGSGSDDLLELAAVANSSEVAMFPAPVWFTTGIYANITGTAPAVSVLYE